MHNPATKAKLLGFKDGQWEKKVEIGLLEQCRSSKQKF